MAALLDIVKLNEYDRIKKANKKLQEERQAEAEPSAKRLKIVQDSIEDTADVPPIPPLIGELGPKGKPLLHGAEFYTLKTSLRDMTKKRRQCPLFRLREMGEYASMKMNIDDRVPMFLSDLQHLIMYTQVGPHSPYSPARWCAIEKYNRLANVNVLIVENVSVFHYMTQESKMPFLSSQFEHKLETITPASYQSDIVKDLSMVPLTGTQMRKFQTNFGSLEAAVIQSEELFDTVKNFFPIDETTHTSEPNTLLPATDKFSRLKLLLSGWQMVEENFPLPIQGLMERKYANYKLTKDKYKHVTPFSQMIAIDCEMCRTSTGDLELTRVSAVNEKHQVFYDTLVKPDNEITDYLTRYSGINKKMMKNVTKKLKDVQEDLRRLLPDDVILVGQSLANDLHALKMMHPYIIDTSVIFNITGDRSRKTKLQVLSREFLMEKIQMGQQGHCSEEDSLACMKLVQLKLKNTLYYGDAVMSNISTELRHYQDMGTSQYATSMLRQCVKMDKTASVTSTENVVKRYKFYMDKGQEDRELKGVACVTATNNEEVLQKFKSAMKDHSLNIAHVKITNTDIVDNTCATLKTLDRWVKEVWEGTMAHGLVVVLLGGFNKANGFCLLQLKRAEIV